MTNDSPSASTRREGIAWLAAVFVLAALLAGWMDLSPLHRYHNADSLIPVLVSLDRWTPFFWEQNRFGMLLPLLALPFRHPFGNLLVQVWLRLFALVLSFFLLARVAVPRRYWPAVGGAALAVVLAVRSVPHLTYLHEQPYFQAMALALGGALLLENGGWTRRIGGSILIALSFWISPGTVFWLLPILLVRIWRRESHPESESCELEGSGRTDRSATQILWVAKAPRRMTRLWRHLYTCVLLGACLDASLAASALYARKAYGGTDLGTVPMKSWPLGWRRLAEEAVHYLSPGWVAAVFVLLAVAAVLSLLGKARGAFSSGLALTAAALCEIAVLGTSGWLHRQLFDVRYLTSGLTALTVAGPALLFCLTLERAPAAWQRIANALVLAALIPLMLFRFGFPSPARAREAVDAGLGLHSEAVLASGATHVIGNFWRVWPAVFHANLRLDERGDDRKIWGITYRSAPTRDLWMPADWTRARFAALGPDGEVERERRRFGIPPLYRKGYAGPVAIATVIPPGVPARVPDPPPPPSPEASPEILASLDFYPIRPCRLLDTLWSEPLVSGAPPLRVDAAAYGTCGIPRGARAVAVNVQTVLPPSDGWIAVFPAGGPRPSLSTISFRGGSGITSRFQILPLSSGAGLALAATVADGGDVRIYLDVTGYFLSRPHSR